MSERDQIRPDRGPVAIIGAGPVGLAAAAQLVLRGEVPIVFEQGEAAADNVRRWEHVKVFSPWKHNVDPAAARLLERHGWQAPDPEELPTGRELRERYLLPLAALPELAPHVHYRSRVVGVGRKNLDKAKTAGREAAPFVLHVEGGIGKVGEASVVEARAVIDASGTWTRFNPVGAGGLPAIGERELADRIFYGIPDVLGRERERYRGRRVMVVGSGHSAFQALLDLGQLRLESPETTIVWSMRAKPKHSTFGGGESDQLPARGLLGERLKRLIESGAITVVAPNRIFELRRTGGGVAVLGEDPASGVRTVEVDEVVATTGSRPDLSFLAEVRLALDPALECAAALGPMIDPNQHSCGTVDPHGELELRHPDTGLYIAGMKSYGRAPTFLMITGYEQVRSIVAGLCGDWEAARRVELVLPETGICVSDEEYDYEAGGAPEAGCCAPAPAAADACCEPTPLLGIGARSAAAKPAALPVAGCCDEPTAAGEAEVVTPEERFSRGSALTSELIYGAGFQSAGGLAVLEEAIVQHREAFARAGLAGAPAGARPRVLDVGCGAGGNSAYFARLGWEVTGIDLSGDMVALCRERQPEGTFLQGDVRELDLPGGYDLVLCRDVGLYVGDKRGFFARFRELLAPAGLALIFDYCASDPPSPEAAAIIHGREWQLLDPDRYAGVLAAAGFAHVERDDLTDRYVVDMERAVRRLAASGASGELADLLAYTGRKIELFKSRALQWWLFLASPRGETGRG